MQIGWRERAIDAATVGIVGGGMGAILSLMVRVGFDSGDVFALAGAAIGASVTVAGAFVVADRSARAAHLRETSILAEYCRPMLVKVREVEPLCPNGTAWTTEFRVGLNDLFRLGIEVPALLDEALDKSQTLDLRERVKIRNAAEVGHRFDQHYVDAFDDPHFDWSMDERQWGYTLERLRIGLEELMEALDRD